MTTLAVLLILLPVGLAGYAYVGYPAVLWLVARFRPVVKPTDPAEWPFISVTVPVYNAAATLAATLDALVAADYPAERRQIVVASDASTDDTDTIAASYSNRGVELLRIPVRRGKTAVENAVNGVVRGDIVINVDAAIGVPAQSLKALVRAFTDPTVGVASGRDRSVGDATTAESARGEGGYVGYEMWVRSLETRVGSIVGASGCFYAYRRVIHRKTLPEGLSWDFASALFAAEHGLRAVSVQDAVCVVPRSGSLEAEFRRKVRTMTRGINTLLYKRALMNPVRYGRFALMLISHKLCRWLVSLTLPAAVVGLVVLSAGSTIAAALLAAALATVSAAIITIRWQGGAKLSPLVALPGFLCASMIAGVIAWQEVFRSERVPIWEPTQRPGAGTT